MIQKKILFWQNFSLQQPGGGAAILKKLISFSGKFGFTSFVCFDEEEVPQEYKKGFSEFKEYPIETRKRYLFYGKLNSLITWLIIAGFDSKAKNNFNVLINNVQPDVIHLTAHGLSFPLFFRLAKKYKKAKIVVSVHDIWTYTLYKKVPPTWFLNSVYKKCLQNSNDCFVISLEMGEYLKKQYGIKKYTVIHDGYDQNNDSKKLVSKKASNRFLYIGLITDEQIELLNRIMDSMSSLSNHQFEIGFCSNKELKKKDFHSNISVTNYGWVDSNKLEVIKCQYSFGLLMLSFKPESLLFYQTSLMTKIPFYIYSELPVYCIGEETAAASQLLKREGTGIFCTENTNQAIINSLTKIVNISNDCYQELVSNTRRSILTTFNSEIIAERFYKNLS